MKQISIFDFLRGQKQDAMAMASEQAFQASHDANDKAGHEAAAGAHKDAMEKAAKKGDTHVADLHARMAKMHGDKAKDMSDDDDGDED